MLKTTPLLLLLAAAVSQVDLSQLRTSFNSTGEFISDCPINFYGRRYTMCIPVCSVTGSSVVDFNGKVHSIPDRCVYSLVKPQGSSSFEVLAGFQERRSLNVPFLDYLKLSLQDTTVTIYLEQGGRVQVRKKLSLKVCCFNGSAVSLNSASQVFNGVELSMDQRAVTAKLLFANVTLSFDGTTAHVSGMGLAAPHEGLCGNPVDPSQTAALSAVNTSSDNAAGCGIQYNDTANPTINCDTATAHCNLMNHTSFAGCHNIIDPQSYITACTDTLCNYPAVNGLQCQFLESYAEACSLSNVSPGNWRSTTNCPVAPSACLTQYCNTHEFCGESSTGPSCYCRAGFASKYKSSNTLGEPAVCTQDSATLSLAACLLEDMNINYSLLSLNDQNCTGHLNQESHMVEFSFNSTNSCGSEVTTNNSQAIFKNTLSMRNSSVNEIITRHNQVFVNFSCLDTAPQPQSASFRIKEGSVVQQIQSGVLNYTLVMSTYKNSALTNVVGPNAEVFLSEKIWLELKAEGLDGTLLALVTDSCWATNQPSPNASLQYLLILNGCPNPKDETVTTQGNGLGLSNVFSFNMFKFTRRSSDVYLHCKLELCYKQSNSCAPVSKMERLSGKIQMLNIHTPNSNFHL
ncbi:alpha-tectorin-like [Nelusetta ayraudi]|uniref:alpha-tectorin-like n=1 Tax=Nelusetta ayraudi TaxID=303726 RepID=UPI003F6E4BB4